MIRRLSRLGPLADPMLRDVAAGAAVAFLLRGAGAVLGFGVNILLARLLGASGAGVYYLAFTVSAIATIVGCIGLDKSFLRFTGTTVGREDWSGLAGVYRKGIGISAVTSIAATLAVLAGAPLIAGTIFGEPALTGPLRVMSLSVPLVSLVMLHGALLKGLGRVRDGMVVQSVGIPAAHMVLLPFLTGPFGVAGAAASYALSAGLIVLLGRHLWRRATPFLRDVSGHFDARVLLDSSVPLFWFAALNWAMEWTDTVMLGIWAGSAEVGVYNVAFRTAVTTRFLLVAVNSVIAPRFAVLYEQGELALVQNLTRKTVRGISLAATPLLLFLVFFPSVVLSLFGPEFVEGALALQILAVGQFVFAATGPGSLLLMMTGHERVIRDNVLVSAIINVIGNALLIPRFGMVGAAAATSFAIVVQNVRALYLVRRKVGIRIW